MNIFKVHKNNKGYTLLFAVITASVVLGVAAFIVGIARKQYILSSTARDSTYAFYSADSGIECVAGNYGILSTSSPGSLYCGHYGTTGKPITYVPNNPNGSSYNIGGVDISSDRIYGTNFTIGFVPQGSDPNVTKAWGCAVIIIDEFMTTTGQLYTIIQSRGYNLCSYNSGTNSYSPDAQSPRTVERGLQWVLK